MSRLVDERVVQMGFDNKSFETNIKTSISSIDRLKSSLNFSGVSSSLNKNLGSVDTSVLTSNIAKVSSGFSLMEVVGISAIANITSRLIDLGLQMVQSLSIDNISVGWDRYAEKTIAVGTMVSQGLDINDVSDEMDKLLFFTDETSYSFTDMVKSISSFTSTGAGLKESSDAIMGIALAAARAGKNTQTASWAMDILSKSMSSGYVGAQQWQSLNLAGLTTKEFQEKILEAASSEEIGELQKTITGLYITKSGKEFDAADIKSELSEKWLTKEVLLKALGSYSTAVDPLYEMIKADNGIDLVADAIKELTGIVDDFGLKAFKSAQEARTFKDMINAVKEAVSTAWMNIFETVFGDYFEAVELWTELSGELIDLFVGDLKYIDKILKSWKGLGGRDDIFANTEEQTGAFWNLFYAITDVVNLIKKSWNTIFPMSEMEKEGDQIQDIAGKLKSFTERLRDMTARLRMSEETAEKLSNVFKGLFSILKAVGMMIKLVWTAIKPLVNFIGFLAGKLFDLLSSLGLMFSTFINKTNIFEVISEKLTIAFENIKGTLSSFGSVDMGGVVKFNGDMIKNFKPLLSFVEGLGKLFAGLWSIVKAVLPVIGKFIGYIGDLLGKLGDKLSGIFSGKNSLFDITKLFDIAFWTALISSAVWIIGSLWEVQFAFSNLLVGFADVVDSKAMMQYAEALKTFSIALLLIVVALILLSSIDQDKLVTSVATLGILMGMMLGMMKIMQTMFTVTKGFGLQALATSNAMIAASTAMIVIAASALILAFAIKIMGQMDQKEMINGVMGLALIITLLLGAASIISKNAKIFSRGAKGLIQLALAVILLTIPMKILGTMDKEQFERGLLGVAALVAMCVLFATAANDVKKSIGVSFGMILFANALLIASIPLKIIGSMSLEQVLIGLFGLAGVLAIMVLFARYGSNIKSAILAAIGLNLMAGSLLQFAITLKVLGSMSLGAILKSIGALIILSAMIFGISKFINPKILLTMAGFGAALAVLSWGLLSFAIAMKALGTVNKKDMGMLAAVFGIIVVVSLFAGVLGFVSPIIAAFGASLVILSIGLVAFGIAIGLLGAMKLETLGKGLLFLVGAFIILGVAAKILQPMIIPMLGIALALMMFAAAAFLLATALSIIVVSLGTFGSIFLSVLLNVLNGIIEAGPKIMLALQVMLDALIGLLTTAITSGITMILTILEKNGPQLIAVIVMLIDTLLATLAKHMPSILESIMSIFRTLNTKLPEIIEILKVFVVTLIVAIIQHLATITPMLAQAMFDLIISLLDSLGEAIEANAVRIREAIIKLSTHMWNAFTKFWGIKSPSTTAEKGAIAIIDGILKGITNGIIRVAERITALAKRMLEILESYFDRFITTGSGLINKLGSGIASSISSVIRTVRSITTDIIKAIRDTNNDFRTLGKEILEKLIEGLKITNMIQTGKDLIGGFVKGIIDAWNSIPDLLSGLGAAAVKIFKDVFGIKSPSRVFSEIGKNIDLGLVKGIEDNSGKIYDSAEGAGDEVLDGFVNSGLSGAIKKIYDLINNGIDDQLVIKPVMDLSEIQNGTNQARSMMQNLNGYAMSGSNNMAEQTYRSIRDGNKSVDSIRKSNDSMSSKLGSENSTINNVFNISSDNPKQVAEEVSRIIQKQIDRRNTRWA